MRAFTGIEISGEVKASIASLQRKMPQNGLTMVKEEAMHITLHFFPEISEQDASNVMRAMDFAAVGEFTVTARGISYFGGRDVRVVFANVEDPSNKISDMYSAMSAILSIEGIEFDSKEAYVPHITIARSRQGNQETREFIEENRSTDFGSFTVSSIFLKKSTLTDSGPIYTELHAHDI